MVCFTEIEMDYLVIMIVIASTVKCDWVEIPQGTVSLDKGTKKPDSQITTSSTTVQTPVFAKPTANKKHNLNHIKTASIESSKATVVRVSNVSSIVPALNNTTKATNNNIINNSSNVVVNNTSYERASDDEATSDEEDNDVEINDGYFYNKNFDFKESTIKHKEREQHGYSYANVIPYMSAIQSTLMKSAHKSRKSKVNVLKNLRDHLLGEIEHRMTSLWNPKTEGRGAREYKDDSHIDFPSNEGALMTIGFLTFAVFLIKLVLHLIQAIHNKMDNSDDGTTTAALIGRKRRSAVNEEAIKILNYIEQYHLK